MVTKYARGDADGPARSTPFRSLPPAPTGRSIWRWMLLGYIAVAVGFSASFGVAGRTGEAFDFAFQPLARGEATVRAVEEGDGAETGHVALELAVTLPGGVEAVAPTTVPANPGAALRPGDRVGVIYRVSRDGARVRIEEAGLVPLPAGAQ